MVRRHHVKTGKALSSCKLKLKASVNPAKILGANITKITSGEFFV